ncbi:alpha/beta hydrolase [Aminobacter anthyllidis]|uniref:Alpha/beta hydrolase n=1 Tax=Aminobacter anthyllidis TaxID=1035067 RepID=A0A9X1A685_9HYPH|nr:alpha/beta hydrolase [Aminobacter anthyllidis]MBT1154074.1 alpha/beta hydrolase [Aminobacter anthyllidis]
MSVLAEEANWPREVLDRDYGARASVTPEVFEAAMRDYRSRSEEMRSHATHVDVVYDEPSGQTIDIYGTGATPRPVFVFIHGGYWRMLSKQDSAFMAAMLAKQGIATAVVDYRLAPEVSLDEIVREVRAAIGFLWRTGKDYGIDPDRIHVGGSSAGGHLTGAVLSSGWHEGEGVPEDVIKGALPISGLFHLAPIANSFVQDWIKLDAAAAERLSPAANIARVGCPIVVAYADGEPDGFRRQSTEYDRLWREAGFASELMQIPGRNHFDVLLDLATEDTVLSKALVRLIKG